jgi:hypothetical protein
VYQAFDRTANVQQVRYDWRLPVFWSLGFYMNPMYSVIGQHEGRLATSRFLQSAVVADGFHRKSGAAGGSSFTSQRTATRLSPRVKIVVQSLGSFTSKQFRSTSATFWGNFIVMRLYFTHLSHLSDFERAFVEWVGSQRFVDV